MLAAFPDGSGETADRAAAPVASSFHRISTLVEIAAIEAIFPSFWIYGTSNPSVVNYSCHCNGKHQKLPAVNERQYQIFIPGRRKIMKESKIEEKLKRTEARLNKAAEEKKNLKAKMKQLAEQAENERLVSRGKIL